MLLLPLALVAVWRTYVHAKRFRETGSRGWLGVLEGGLLGAGATALLVGFAVARNVANGGNGGGPPDATWLQAAGYVAAYVLIFGALGVAVGFVLWLPARIVLHLRGCPRDAR